MKERMKKVLMEQNLQENFNSYFGVYSGNEKCLRREEYV
jgi:hypothetical protein